MFKKEDKETDPRKDKDRKDTDITLTKEEYQDLTQKARQKDEAWDKYLRLYAEYDNSKKLWDKNKAELLKFGNFRILNDFAIILDEIEVALLNLNNEHKDKDHTEGLKIIYKKIKDVLLKEGLKPIEAKGKKFDPHLHEALFFEEKDDLEEHTVIEVIQQGYSYGDKVLRPARVKVSVKPKETQDKDDTRQATRDTREQDNNNTDKQKED